jgi:nucleotide-binding universal stress UspA family protein
MFANILLPVDGSPPSVHAACHGIGLAKALSARATVLTVTIPWSAYFSRELAVVVPDAIISEAEYDRKREVAAASVLKNVADQASCEGVEVTSLHECGRHPHRVIVDVANREKCDLIVMGSYSDQGLTGSLLNSEVMKVLTQTRIPVLVYRWNNKS